MYSNANKWPLGNGQDFTLLGLYRDIYNYVFLYMINATMHITSIEVKCGPIYILRVAYVYEQF